MGSFKEKEIFHFDLYNFYVSIMTLKLKITTFLIHNCKSNEKNILLPLNPNLFVGRKCPQ